MRDLQRLPKADLHCHLEGCARPSTIGDLAAKYGTDVGDLTDYTDLLGFLVKFEAARSVIGSIGDLTRIAYEFVVDRSADGAVYVEPDWDPFIYTGLDGLRGASTEERAEEVFAAVDRAMSSGGIAHGHLLGGGKADGETAEQLATFAVAHRNRRVVSFGYAGDERLPHSNVARAVCIAIEGGLSFVPHAGETRGAESVAEVLDMGATRIGHGINAIHDAAVLKRLAASDVVCDVALSSNLRLGIVSSLDVHPLPQLLEAGVPVTLGTDDSLFFGSSLLDEYELARKMGLDDEVLAQIARNSVSVAGVPDDVRTTALRDIDRWLAVD